MNATKHDQYLTPSMIAIAAVLFFGLPGESFADDDESQRSASATPVAQVSSASPVATTVKRDKGIAKLLAKTMKTVSHKKKRPTLPMYNAKGKLKNDIATRLLDPQRKESPIRTARLFKIPISETQTAQVEEKVISGPAAVSR